MKMLYKFVLVGAAAMFLLGSSAQAGVVHNDSGSVGGFTLTNLGGGSFTLLITGPSSLDSINGAPTGGIATTFDASIAFTATVSGTDVTVTGGGPYTKTFGTAPDDAALSYGLALGKIGTGLLQNGLILGGLITTVAPNALPGEDFSGMTGGTHTFVLTGTFYTGGAHSMADVFATTGSSVVGNGAFAEVAVPEPASMALLGIGMTGLLAFRRFRLFKRSSAA